MKLSTQLVLSMLGITILAQAVFGGVAYWIIDDSHDQNHNEVLQHIVKTIDNDWLTSETKKLTQSDINKIHAKFAAEGYYPAC